MTEKQLVAKVLTNNKKAINLFYQTYQPKLLNYIRKKVDNLKDAEEILQDTFLSSLDTLPLFKFNSSLSTWLISISRHEISDFYRRRKIKALIFSHFPFLKKIVDKALGPELALQEKEAKQKIISTFKNLTEGYSQILRLKYVDGLSMKQIAKKLGKTVKAVESKLTRARLAFQKEYDNQGQKNSQILNSPLHQGKLSF